MSEKKELEVSSNMNLKQVVEYLKDLTKSLEAGKTVIQNGDEFLALSPQDEIEVSIDAAQKKDKEKLSIELKWKKSFPVEKPNVELKITSKEPVIAPTETAKETADKLTENLSKDDKSKTTKKVS